MVRRLSVRVEVRVRAPPRAHGWVGEELVVRVEVRVTARPT